MTDALPTPDHSHPEHVDFAADILLQITGKPYRLWDALKLREYANKTRTKLDWERQLKVEVVADALYSSSRKQSVKRILEKQHLHQPLDVHWAKQCWANAERAVDALSDTSETEWWKTPEFVKSVRDHPIDSYGDPL